MASIDRPVYQVGFINPYPITKNFIWLPSSTIIRYPLHHFDCRHTKGATISSDWEEEWRLLRCSTGQYSKYIGKPCQKLKYLHFEAISLKRGNIPQSLVAAYYLWSSNQRIHWLRLSILKRWVMEKLVAAAGKLQQTANTWDFGSLYLDSCFSLDAITIYKSLSCHFLDSM